MRNKYLWMSILLAILVGVLACACHKYSIEKHRMTGDTLDGRIMRVEVSYGE